MVGWEDVTDLPDETPIDELDKMIPEHALAQKNKPDALEELVGRVKARADQILRLECLDRALRIHPTPGYSLASLANPQPFPLASDVVGTARTFEAFVLDRPSRIEEERIADARSDVVAEMAADRLKRKGVAGL